MLLRATPEKESRTLATVGAVTLLCAAIVAGWLWIRPSGQSDSQLSIVIDTPFVGQGVAAGTALILHGVPVGRVTAVASLPGGGVRLSTDLDKEPAAGLTDTLHVDFRPANYFGVTGVNIIPADDGHGLVNGTRIAVVPSGNFTLQALLARFGQLSNGVLTPQLISVIDRVTRYTDGLNPLIESLLIAADAVARVQTVSTQQLLRNTTGISAAFPAFVDALTTAGENFRLAFDRDYDDEFHFKKLLPSAEKLAIGFFGAVGKLESSHQGDLTPAIEIVKTFADTLPGLALPGPFADTARQLRTRLEHMYAGSPEQRALQVRIVLDQLPGVAAPFAQLGAQ
ncbi:virulence factor Mce family protein [Mycobacteroides abscessus subsp. bolletii]|uniref:MlaD family protein n=1 Tax=Mycobacteroides abscessus TaxID=36809 RepID=UPI00092C323A|nr:Mammalian cell entry related domain protein [Mycobacteroides abscessus]SHX52959.1 virulence factor Mce family protein [Mycobacteroides abscessus subsp. bolletii]SKP62169.1 virulence factor Mce family protein [Mycobacteroides abscessus subsp. bolletii]SKP73720.1 virulence factor Mce family protein [Mycobacteroides abscessus subsp. bolletii]SKQ21146.1 virulence factor Mce family protein [Mycobacteroides abscessus subsp. bolletii]